VTRWLTVRWRIDRAVAVVLSIVSAPLAGVLWLLVRVVDGPPAIVRLPRIGQGGTEFAMSKFRSMAVQTAAGQAGGSALTMGADPRVTSLGRRLRHYRLDELPQLANVLRGEMALVGPRPETPVYVDLGDRRWQAVVQALPGIAGPTQVLIHDFEAGLGVDDLKRYEAEMVPVKLAIDQWYLAHASPIVDLLVLWALVQRFLLRRPVTTLHRRLEREIPEVADLLLRHTPDHGADDLAGPSPATSAVVDRPIDRPVDQAVEQVVPHGTDLGPARRIRQDQARA
jgi:lipopolysaccharide/colanic/teichoic acid biosynthesis glycosyltransferase